MDTTYEYDMSDPDAEFTEFQRFKEMFEADFEHYISGTTFTVETSNHGWRGLSGTFEKEYENGVAFLEDIIEASKFSLKVSFEEGFCRVVLYTHDNPTGASFELTET